MFSMEVDKEIKLALLQIKDAEELYGLIAHSRESLRPWLLFIDNILSSEDTKSFIESNLFNYEANDGFSAGIWYNDKLVGTIGFHRMDNVNRKVEIGYWIDQDMEGRGIMTRCCRAMIRYAFIALSINRVEIRAGVENRRSRAIPERLGFQLEGILRQSGRVNNHHFIDEAVYGMLIGDWISREMT